MKKRTKDRRKIAAELRLRARVEFDPLRPALRTYGDMFFDQLGARFQGDEFRIALGLAAAAIEAGDYPVQAEYIER